jgi:hypothetical protein
LPEAVLKGEDELLPGRSAALARFAAALTARPWSITPTLGAELAAEGLARADIESATGVVAMFNYLTRVADSSGIEFDYASPLPVFQPSRDKSAPRRPDPASWPVAELRTLPALPELTEALRDWREYLLESDEPLPRRDRLILAAAAAQECCDRLRADELAEYTNPESILDGFARKISLAPWQTGPADLQSLRDAGYPERAILHAISVVAHQNAESRLAMGVSLTR